MDLHKRLDVTLELLADLDAGNYCGDEDQPMLDFIEILNGTARDPIETDDQLRILHKGIAYLMQTESDAPRYSIEAALDIAIREAITGAPNPLQGALLALVRHQMRGHRINPLDA
ncbi:hypothetical protein MKL09_21915 [Methylobacterium sp. J-048]|uniref:hypothetical protein n=1 Tax=Methylobacterium sp. J-048 TaxID=2836635 RepID=UPI001FB92440|nr:hypothetical protein [Methylobacterium sp. J-048]MCJ2059184.1 hypothetical protein [Methylobacterium sp. J-048]